MDSDGEILARVVRAIEEEDFLRAALLDDVLDDWNLARDCGAFLVRIEPDSEVLGHALLTRAYRHLGNAELALEELKKCRNLTANRRLAAWEMELIHPLLVKEEGLISESSGLKTTEG